MVQETVSLYVSTTLPVAGARWRSLRLPAVVHTPSGRLESPGLPVGAAVAPGGPLHGVRARLVVHPALPGRAVTVEVGIQPWSEQRVELGLRPAGRLPLLVGPRSFLRAAHAVLGELAQELELQGILQATAAPATR